MIPTVPTWSAAVGAVAQVLEALIPGSVGRRTPSPGCSVLLISYADDFDEIWRFRDELLEWVGLGNRHVMVVWHDNPHPKRSAGTELSDCLTAHDWALALTLAASERAGLTQRWRLTILDFTPLRHQDELARRAKDGLVRRTGALLPHVACVTPCTFWQFLGAFSSLAPPEMPPPESREELQALWRSLQRKGTGVRPPADDASLQGLRRALLAAYAEAINRENQRYRHGQGAFCAAVRLLLGGMQAGAISLQWGRKLLRNLRDKQPQSSPDDYDFDLLERYIDLQREVGETPTASADQSARGRRRVLIIDDEYKTAGWEVVLPALFSGWQVDVGGPLLLRTKMAVGLSDCQLILLDHFLGDDAETTGIELLNDIRALHPFIPVVLFTMEDDSALFSEAMDRGANGYFVKELADTADRDSASYFAKFRHMIEHFERLDPTGPSRILEVSKRLEALQSRIPWLDERLTARDTLVARAVTALERAVVWWAYALQGALGDPKEAHRAIGINLGQSIEALDALEEREESRTLLHGRAFARESRHGGDLGTVLNERIQSLLSAAIERLEKVTVVPGPLAVSPPRPKADVGSTLRVRRVHTGTHQQRSVRGAVRFTLGYYAARGADADKISWCGLEMSEKTIDSGHEAVSTVIAQFDPLGNATVEIPAESPAYVLLVDDTAHEDGWLLALRTALFPTFGVRHLSYRGSQDNEELCRQAGSVDKLLLDLRLPASIGQPPKEGVGLEVLQTLRQRFPYLPVVVFSADEDVLWTRRCLELGAVAYFPKTWKALPLGEDWDGSSFYGGYYRLLRSHIDGQGPSAGVARLRSVSDRLSREKRYRAIAEGSGLTEWIRGFSGFIATLGWVRLDPHLRWLHAHIVHRPTAWVGTEASITEATVSLTALIEHLLRQIISRHRKTARVQFVTLGGRTGLIALAEPVLNEGPVVGQLHDLNGLRNMVYHLTDKDDGKAPSPPTLAGILHLATQILPVLTRKLFEECLATSSPGPDGIGLAALLERGLDEDARQPTRVISGTHEKRTDLLLRRWSDAENIHRVAAEAHRQSTGKHEEVRSRLAELEEHRGLEMMKAVDRRGAKMVEDTYGPLISRAKAELATAESEVGVKAAGLEQAAKKREECRYQYREHIDRLPPLPQVSTVRRRAVVRDWIEERSVEEKSAVLAGGEPGRCCWEGEPLSKDVQDLVEAIFASGDAENVWPGVRAWIEGARVSPGPD